MDFHPLVIHYPIAFLTTYVVFELLRFGKLLKWPHWFYIKTMLVIIGEVSAIITLIAAMMSDALANGDKLVEMYKLFMFFTVIIFGIIAFIYTYREPKPIVIFPLAIAGLFLIVIAGGLFGATIYGTHFDPYLAPVFRLLNVY